MSTTCHAIVLGSGIALLLAACGGQSDDAPAQAEQRPSISRALAEPVPPVGVRAAAGDEMAAVHQQLAQLRRDVAEIRQELARRPEAAISQASLPNPRTDANARLEAERVEQQRIVATESAFRSEREDSRWSQGTMAAVQAALAEADDSLRSQVGSIECRSQSCRVVIGSDPGSPAGQDLSLVMSRLASTLPNVTAGQIDQGNGRMATVLYLSR